MSGNDEWDRHEELSAWPPRGGADEPPDRHTEDVLRRALRTEAARVQLSGDGLERIRARTTRAGAAPRWLLPLAAAAAGVVIVGGVAWAVDDVRQAPVASDGRPSAESTAAASDAVGALEAPGDAEPVETPEGTRSALPVYYVGEQPPLGDDGQPAYLLFREFHATTTAEAPDRATRVQLAVEEMLAAAPLDPDYDTPVWPSTASVRSAAVDESTGVVTVDLAGIDADLLADAGAVAEREAAAAVQQLVFTATAAASVDATLTTEGDHLEPTGVQLLVDGQTVDTLFGAETAQPIARNAGAFRAPVWIISVDEGESVVDPQVFEGEANVGEGRLEWAISSVGGDVVQSATVELPCCGWHRFAIAVGDPLPPGDYELTVYAVPEGSPDGDVPYDSKSFVVVE